jgi:arsenate reductase
MYQLIEIINNKIDVQSISEERKTVLQPLIDFTAKK